MKPYAIWLLLALPFGIAAACLAYADQGLLCFLTMGVSIICATNAAAEYEGA